MRRLTVGLVFNDDSYNDNYLYLELSLCMKINKYNIKFIYSIYKYNNKNLYLAKRYLFIFISKDILNYGIKFYDICPIDIINLILLINK